MEERTEAGEGYDATPYLPARGDLTALRRAAADCRGCPLFRDATQTVFGAGSASARTVFVGEQPGDQEDRQGEPFVGPAGRLLRKAMDEVGLDEREAYFTNAVKHFKFTVAARGKRRIHKAPSLRELTACRPWLNAELARLDPEVIVVLGATAAKTLLGSSFRVTKERGAPIESERGLKVATVHPSSVLRSDDRAEAYAGLVSDLRVVAGLLE
ncbi:UdgX family uracil-DNA binding protein [Streptomyces sp. NPDC021749]|uniref:UdgX family uracil-DNA binding protein n=1 Tax=Streptomyces sp. NPDC021749 TaxID=3154905 RepID=UPI0033EAFF5D